ncbi:regulatory protein RecX [Bosea sp. (in: a-proteobacteria)]|uniref:regulatory protein RecX n=1 Tax=Bosea sp. (in: a-proteobacteria) TaxID=1871050 RepID=UPI002FCB666B
MTETTGEGASRQSGSRQDGSRRAPRPITPSYLQRAALHYLHRYAASSSQLQRVLQRKVERSCRHYDRDPGDFHAMVAEAVAACVASGLVDDRRFAEMRTKSLRRKGRSARAVSAGLAAKGIAREIVAATLPDSEEDELAAARIAARRKRLGPWSRAGREQDRQKQLATLARAGFSMKIARAVIDGAGEES